MIKWIKKFITDRGWYKKSKGIRHIAGSVVLVLIFAGVQSWFVGNDGIIWPLAGLLAWTFGFIKELIESKKSGKIAWEDVKLNTIGVLFGLIPWFIIIFLAA